VPAAAADPLPCRRLGDGGGHAGDDLLPARRAGERELEVGPADPLEVGVALDEAGDREAAGELDHAGRGADPGRDLLPRAERHDAAVGHGERLGFGTGRIHGDDPAALQDELGRRRVGRGRGGREEEGEEEGVHGKPPGRGVRNGAILSVAGLRAAAAKGMLGRGIHHRPGRAAADV